MPAVLPAPSATDSAENHADWLELRALLADDRRSSLTDLGRALRPTGTIEEVIDEQFDGGESPAELVDPGDDFLEMVTDAASSELDDRELACGSGYPFVRGEQYLEATSDAVRSVYAFLLLLSAHGVDAGPVGLDPEKVFEDVSAEAATDYFGGAANRVDCYPFGFPRRRTVRGFRPAIRELVSRLGEGGGPRDRPTTRDQKDAKLDLVIWRAFQDQRDGKLIAFGQCAAGNKWRDQLTEMQPLAFAKNWLTDPLSVDPLKMFFCPFRVDRRRWETVVNEAGILLTAAGSRPTPPISTTSWLTSANSSPLTSWGSVPPVRNRFHALCPYFAMFPESFAAHWINRTTLFSTTRPAFADDDLLSALENEGATVTAKPISSGSSGLLTILGGILPTVLLIGFWIWIMQRYWGQMSQGGGMFGMGGSKSHKYEASAQRTTFADVAGIDEAEDELEEVVDFLKHPDRYTKLGAQIPHGVLLSGEPGTGKTLLARAVAGEANVPFYSISASEFVEMIVGVGASRVRDLFEQAKADAPSIIFIDELDAIGRSRSSGATSGSNDEREQTLNQILTEMDGFTGNEGVIVLAATNRPEVLDSALLRPGRFDRRITVQAPDQQGRLKILRVHTRNVPLKDPSDLEAMAASTPGMVGADLKNLVNEAALNAARRGEQSVSLGDFSNALERITIGAARRIVLSEEERRRTAYHESGHALLGMLQPGADPVRKISIIPRGQALGVTYQSPESDRYGYGASYLRGRLIGMLGGRAAEILIYGETTTGPESDLEQATSIARQMVGRWGMSEEIGAVSAFPRSGADNYPPAAELSQHTLELIDDEVKRIISECAGEAKRQLAEHREQLDHLAQTLLERETLDEADAYAAAGIPQPGAAPQPVVTA